MTAVLDIAHPIYLRTLLSRTVLLWVLGRVVVMSLSASLGEASIQLDPKAVVMLAALLAVLAQTDARIMRETLFHANLGTPRRASALLTFFFVIVVELVIMLIARAAA